MSKQMTRKEAIFKAVFWRVFIAVPLGTLITYLFVGEIWKSVSLMLFMNIFFTFVHYQYELLWDKIISSKRSNNVEEG